MKPVTAILVMCAVLPLLACEPQVTLPCQKNFGVVGYVPRKDAAAEAAELFARTCLDTAPTFAAAEERFVAAGLNGRSETGMRYDRCRGVSARVTRSDASSTCSVVFEDPDAQGAMAALQPLVTERWPDARPADRDGASIWATTVRGTPIVINFSPAESGRPLPSYGISAPSSATSN